MDQQQLGSIDRDCHLAACYWGTVGSGQRCCWPLNATVSRFRFDIAVVENGQIRSVTYFVCAHSGSSPG